jgi:hypothetical protein
MAERRDIMAILIELVLKALAENAHPLNPELNPNLNPQLDPRLNPDLNPNLNDELNPSLNANLNPNLNPNYMKEEYRLLKKYLGRHFE